jgi:hypothetical protein
LWNCGFDGNSALPHTDVGKENCSVQDSDAQEGDEFDASRNAEGDSAQQQQRAWSPREECSKRSGVKHNSTKMSVNAAGTTIGHCEYLARLFKDDANNMQGIA